MGLPCRFGARSLHLHGMLQHLREGPNPLQWRLQVRCAHTHCKCIDTSAAAPFHPPHLEKLYRSCRAYQPLPAQLHLCMRTLLMSPSSSLVFCSVVDALSVRVHLLPCGPTRRIGTALAMKEAMENMESMLPELKLPFCAIHGTLDGVTDPEVCPRHLPCLALPSSPFVSFPLPSSSLFCINYNYDIHHCFWCDPCLFSQL